MPATVASSCIDMLAGLSKNEHLEDAARLLRESRIGAAQRSYSPAAVARARSFLIIELPPVALSGVSLATRQATTPTASRDTGRSRAAPLPAGG